MGEPDRGASTARGSVPHRPAFKILPPLPPGIPGARLLRSCPRGLERAVLPSSPPMNVLRKLFWPLRQSTCRSRERTGAEAWCCSSSGQGLVRQATPESGEPLAASCHSNTVSWLSKRTVNAAETRPESRYQNSQVAAAVASRQREIDSFAYAAPSHCRARDLQAQQLGFVEPCQRPGVHPSRVLGCQRR